MHVKQWKGFLSGVALSSILSTLVMFNNQREERPLPNFQDYNVGSSATWDSFVERRRHCRPSINVAFLKIHKAGSSTVANILQRFGYTRNLNFVVPNKQDHVFGYNYIGQFGDTVSRNDIIPLPPGQTYNILWNHVTYDHDAFRDIMPPDTKYVTILREPFDQFVSAFDYYFLGEQRRNASSYQNSIEAFLDNARHLQDSSFLRRLKNSQAYDLGFQKKHFGNATLRLGYIHQLSDDFDVVMLMEYFDESLVLLKRVLCWSLKDILYFPHNKNYLKRQRVYLRTHHLKHKRLSGADYDLYAHFQKVFWNNVWREGPGFFEEVRYFKGLLNQLRNYCMIKRTLRVSSSQWGRGFVVNQADCMYIQMSELAFYDTIRNRTFSRFFNND